MSFANLVPVLVRTWQFTFLRSCRKEGLIDQIWLFTVYFCVCATKVFLHLRVSLLRAIQITNLLCEVEFLQVCVGLEDCSRKILWLNCSRRSGMLCTRTRCVVCLFQSLVQIRFLSAVCIQFYYCSLLVLHSQSLGRAWCWCTCRR
jgi:hypothetical protein